MARIPHLVLLVLLLAPAAQASTLYKSIGANGTVMFSDMPPGPDARIVEQREIRPSTGTWSSSGPGSGFDLAEQLIDSDAALARANSQVDQAERALAEARRVTFTPREGLKISSPRLKPADEERIETCKRGVKIARQQLMELLRDRQRG
jgi:hypothetical protein